MLSVCTAPSTAGPGLSLGLLGATIRETIILQSRWRAVGGHGLSPYWSICRIALCRSAYSVADPSPSKVAEHQVKSSFLCHLEEGEQASRWGSRPVCPGEGCSAVPAAPPALPSSEGTGCPSDAVLFFTCLSGGAEFDRCYRRQRRGQAAPPNKWNGEGVAGASWHQ